MTRSFTLTCLAVCLGIFTSFAQSPSVECNDQINVAVNHNCAVDLTVDAFLEGDVSLNDDVQNGLYTYEVYNHTGILVLGGIHGPTYGGDDMAEWVNSLLFYKVFYDGTPTCWGTVLLEDKIVPTVDCSVCPEVYGNSADDYDADCVRNCFEKDIIINRYDRRLRDRIVQEDYEDFLEDYVEDNCSNWAPELTSFYDHWEDFGPCEGSKLVRTWKVAYENYNSSVGYINCVREYFFKPINLQDTKEYPVSPLTNRQDIKPIEDCLILPINLVEIDCSFDNSPAGIAAYFDDKNTPDLDSDDDNIDPDELDIDAVVENNEGVPYGFPHYYLRGVGSNIFHPQAVNNEVCNLITGYTDNSLEVCAPGCSGNRKILRTWTILDWCSGEFIQYGQIIKAVDRYGPEIDVPELTVSVDPWACTATVNLPHPEHIFDNCDSYTSYFIGTTGGLSVSGNADDGFVLHDAYLGQHRIEYRSVDCCGNVGRSYMNITVVDDTPPVAVSKEFIVISLTNISNPINGYQGTANVYARDLDNGSYDGCSGVTIEVSRDPVCRNADANWGDFVTFCCEDLEGFASMEIKVRLRITDANGNSNEVWSRVLLEDKSNEFPTTPPHMILTCDMDYNDFSITGGFPKIFGACGEAEFNCDTLDVIENTEPRELRLSDGVVINGIPQEAPAYDPGCGFGAIRRQFRDCGGGVQWFIILPVDPFDHTSIIWPDDKLVDCNDYDNGQPDWLESTCNLVGVSVESDTFMFDGNSCMKILNHWSVINWCIYDPTNPYSPGKYTYTQLVKIIDTVDPVISLQDSLQYSVFDNCTSKDLVLEATAEDNGLCGSDWINWELSVDINSDWIEDYHYSSSYTPYLVYGDKNPYYIPESGNGETVSISLPDGIYGSEVWHRAVWRAYDGCGNTTSKMSYFQIRDNKAPTPYCLNLSTAVMESGQVELWAIDFNKGSFDNCTEVQNLIFTFTDVPPPARDDTEYDSNSDLQWYNGTFWYYNSEKIDPDTGAGEYEKQDDYGGAIHRWDPGLRSAGKVFTIADAGPDGFVELPVYVWDENTNIDFCLVNLRLVDNGGGGMAMVSGKVKTEFGEPVENIETNITGPLNYREEQMTDGDGQFAFVETPFFADYKISGTREDDYMNGVSTLDLVLIQRHILGQESLDSPYKMIAADVNNDAYITALDLIELRKLILGIYNQLPNSASWKLINAEDQLSLSNPWNFSESRTILDLIDDHMQEDFIGVKMGDVNGSVQANSISRTSSIKSAAQAQLIYADQEVAASETFEIELKAEGIDFHSFQLSLNTPGMELIGMKGVLGKEHVYQSGDILNISYNGSQSLIGESVVLVFDSKFDGLVSESLSIAQKGIHSEAYAGINNQVLNLGIQKATAEEDFQLYQNTPNPFNASTNIRFTLPAASDIELSVYSLTGQLVRKLNAYYEKGTHAINFDAGEFSEDGMYYYKLTAGSNTATRQMIIIR